MVVRLVKIFSYLFLSLFVLIFLACLWRIVKEKDPFISIRYLLDYFNYYNGFENINNIQGDLETLITSITKTIANFPHLHGYEPLSEIADLLKYIGSILCIPIEILLYSIFIVKDLLVSLYELIAWVFGFLPYVLAY